MSTCDMVFHEVHGHFKKYLKNVVMFIKWLYLDLSILLAFCSTKSYYFHIGPDVLSLVLAKIWIERINPGGQVFFDHWVCRCAGAWQTFLQFCELFLLRRRDLDLGKWKWLSLKNEREFLITIDANEGPLFNIHRRIQ